jgi:hypothetical protein
MFAGCRSTQPAIRSGPAGAVKCLSRSCKSALWRFCTGAQGAYQPKTAISGPGRALAPTSAVATSALPRAARRQPDRSRPAQDGSAPSAVSMVNRFCMGLLCRRAGRLAAQNGGCRPGQLREWSRRTSERSRISNCRGRYRLRLCCQQSAAGICASRTAVHLPYWFALLWPIRVRSGFRLGWRVGG